MAHDTPLPGPWERRPDLGVATSIGSAVAKIVAAADLSRGVAAAQPDCSPVAPVTRDAVLHVYTTDLLPSARIAELRLFMTATGDGDKSKWDNRFDSMKLGDHRPWEDDDTRWAARDFISHECHLIATDAEVPLHARLAATVACAGIALIDPNSTSLGAIGGLIGALPMTETTEEARALLVSIDADEVAHTSDAVRRDMRKLLVRAQGLAAATQPTPPGFHSCNADDGVDASPAPSASAREPTEAGDILNRERLFAAMRRRDDLFRRAEAIRRAAHPFLDKHAASLQAQLNGHVLPAQERVRLGSLLGLNTSHPAAEKVMDSVAGAVGVEGSLDWFRLLAVLGWLNAELRFLVDDDPVAEVAPKGYNTSLRVLSVRIRFLAHMARLASENERALLPRQCALLASAGTVLVVGDDQLRRHSRPILAPLLALTEFADIAELSQDALDGVGVGDLARALRDALRRVHRARRDSGTSNRALCTERTGDTASGKTAAPSKVPQSAPAESDFADRPEDLTIGLEKADGIHVVVFRNEAGQTHTVDARWKPAPTLPALIRSSGKVNQPWKLLEDLCSEGELDEDDRSCYGEDSRRNLNKWLRRATGARGAFVSKSKNLGNIVPKWLTPQHDHAE